MPLLLGVQNIVFRHRGSSNVHAHEELSERDESCQARADSQLGTDHFGAEDHHPCAQRLPGHPPTVGARFGDSRLLPSPVESSCPQLEITSSEFLSIEPQRCFKGQTSAKRIGFMDGLPPCFHS